MTPQDAWSYARMLLGDNATDAMVQRVAGALLRLQRDVRVSMLEELAKKHENMAVMLRDQAKLAGSEQMLRPIRPPPDDVPQAPLVPRKR